MSVSEYTGENYIIETSETNYNRFKFDTREEAEAVIEEYKNSTNFREYLAHAFKCAIGYQEPTPLLDPQKPNEVVVIDDKTEELSNLADEVLEE